MRFRATNTPDATQPAIRFRLPRYQDGADVSAQVPQHLIHDLMYRYDTPHDSPDEIVTAAIIRLLERENPDYVSTIDDLDTRFAQRVLRANPTLDSNGFTAEAPVDLSQFDALSLRVALRWLTNEHRRFGVKAQGSYGLKHACEQAVGRYVSNGTLIFAALMLGYLYTVRPAPGRGNPNALISRKQRGSKQKSPDAK